MSLARKCDRCGKLYEYYPGFNAIEIVKVNEDKSIIYETVGEDLCFKCMNELIDFMGGEI